PQSPPQAHEPELHRVEPDPREGGHGAARSLRGGLPPPVVPAERCHAPGHARRAPGAGALEVMEAAPELQARIEALHALPATALGDDARATFDAFREALEKGEVRAAEPGDEGWRVNGWVKKGILLGFRLGKVVEMDTAGPLQFFDKDTFP